MTALEFCPWAHPRSRGEHSEISPVRPREPGSSPLARGALAAQIVSFLAPRLIPARAGSTAWSRSAAWPSWAHPRSRGEHKIFPAGVKPVAGSSPLARGAPRGGVARRQRVGLIPARAGSTGSWNVSSVWMGAHPRSRGEHVMALVPIRYRRGSSPLARGAQFKLSTPSHDYGLIPARAGSTFHVSMKAARMRAHPRSRGEHVMVPTRRMGLLGSSPLARGARILRRIQH